MRTGRPIRSVVVAHRGASGYLPEHTFPAKALAYSMGADYLEQDIVATKDDELIVVHDLVLDRTTNVAQKYPERARDDGRYYARDFTIAEIQALDAHERVDVNGDPVFPGRYPIGADAFRVHTFAEELRFISHLRESVGRPVGIYPEIKHPAIHRQSGVDITRLVLNELQAHGYESRDDAVYLQCFDAEELRRIRKEFRSELKLIQLVGAPAGDKTGTDNAAMLTRHGLKSLAKTANGIGPRLEELYSVDRETGNIVETGLVNRAHAYGLAVHPYTLRRDALPPGFKSVEALLLFLIDELQIDGVFTDFPDLLVHRQRGN